MAKATPKLVAALRKSAHGIKSGERYEWGHVGRCNCGHLVQHVSQKSSSDIIKSFGPELDEWTELANDYCGTTGLPLEMLFDDLESVGFYPEDVRKLEYLNDEAVLARLPKERRHLRHNQREDVALYMETMAEMLEEESLLA